MTEARCNRLTATRLTGLLVLIATIVPCMASAGTLDRIRQDKTIRIAYRADARPFSYKDDIGEPAGFMVDLCREVARKLPQQLNLPSLSVTYVTVTAADRFDAIQQNKADLLCEPTSATLSRRELVDFSITTFVDGASLMIGPDGPRNLQSLAGQKVGVLAGTTTEQALRNSLISANISANVVPTQTHAEGLALLDGGTISAYFADRSILVFLINNSKSPDKLTLADAYLTVEPYGLALARGDEDFRLEVDRALSRIYRSGEIGSILRHTFGDNVEFGPILQALYLVSAFAGLMQRPRGLRKVGFAADRSAEDIGGLLTRKRRCFHGKTTVPNERSLTCLATPLSLYVLRPGRN